MASTAHAVSAAASPTLSALHMEVIELIAEGLPSHRIGKRLFFAEETVKSRLAGAFRALDACNRAQAVAEAHRRGLLLQRPSEQPVPALSDEQYQILTLIAEGLESTEIAVELSMTKDMVKNRVVRIRHAFQARNTAHLVHLAYSSGVLTDVNGGQDFTQAVSA